MSFDGHDGMASTRRYLSSLGLPERDLGELPDSAKRFFDGAQFRRRGVPRGQGRLTARIQAPWIQVSSR